MQKFIFAFLLVIVLFSLCMSKAWGGTIEKIKSRGYMIAGVQDSIVPFGYIDEKTNKIVGFEVDICRFLAEKLGVDLKLKAVNSSTRIPMLVQGSVDILAASMTHTFTREESIDFSITYFRNGQRILVKNSSGIATLTDLSGKKVGTAKESTAEKNIRGAQPECKIISFENYSQAFQALRKGKLNAVTADTTTLLGLKKSAPSPAKWEIRGDFISRLPYALAFTEDNSDFRDFVNKALADMWNSSQYKTLFNKWFGKETQYHLPLTWEMEIWPY